jgi:site-specific recombinase XerC
VQYSDFAASAVALDPQPQASAELARLTSQAGEYIRAGKANSTLRAYRADWQHFECWCQRQGFFALPASPEIFAFYLGEFGGRHASATLTRRLTSINKVHRAAGHPAPALMQHLAVGETLKGIRRTHGTEQTPKQPLFTENLRAMIDRLPNTTIGVRDRAVLLIGFAGALRRSELVNVRLEDVAETKEGLVIRIRRSKTDQEGKGRQVAIPYGSVPETCPVRAYREWIAAGELTEGALFRRINRHGHVNDRALHRDSIGMIVKRRSGRPRRESLCRSQSARGSLHAGIYQRRPRTRHHAADRPQVARDSAKVYPRPRAVSRQPGRETRVVEADRRKRVVRVPRYFAVIMPDSRFSMWL